MGRGRAARARPTRTRWCCASPSPRTTRARRASRLARAGSGAGVADARRRAGSRAVPAEEARVRSVVQPRRRRVGGRDRPERGGAVRARPRGRRGRVARPARLRAGSGAGVAPARAPTGRIPAPSPQRRRALGASSSLGAGASDPRAPGARDADASDYDPRFNNESGCPRCVTRPGPHVTCRACRDVFRSRRGARRVHVLPAMRAERAPRRRTRRTPRAASCSARTTSPPTSARVSARRRAARPVQTRPAVRDSATGVGRWTHEPEGCAATVAVSGAPRAHEDACGFARSRCALPFGNASGDGDGGDGDTDSCPMVVYRHEREKHRASCPYRLVPCSIPGRASAKTDWRSTPPSATRKSLRARTCAPGAAASASSSGTGRRARWKPCVRPRGHRVGRGRRQAEGAVRVARAEAGATHDEQCPSAASRVATRRARARGGAHERVCAARRITCDTCGDSVLEAKLAAHVETECHKSDKSTRARCEFHRFGCAFSGPSRRCARTRRRTRRSICVWSRWRSRRPRCLTTRGTRR